MCNNSCFTKNNKLSKNEKNLMLNCDTSSNTTEEFNNVIIERMSNNKKRKKCRCKKYNKFYSDDNDEFNEFMTKYGNNKNNECETYDSCQPSMNTYNDFVIYCKEQNKICCKKCV